MADLLAAISVFLVFLTFLLNSIEKEVTNILSKKKPEQAQSNKLRQYKNDLKKVLFLKSLPITLIFIVSFYVLLPDTIKIFSSSRFNLWNFDELNTLFVFIEFGLLCLTIYSAVKTIQLFNNIRKS